MGSWRDYGLLDKSKYHGRACRMSRSHSRTDAVRQFNRLYMRRTRWFSDVRLRSVACGQALLLLSAFPPPEPELQASFGQGHTLYSRHWSNCRQTSGTGEGLLYPHLGTLDSKGHAPAVFLEIH